MSSSHGSSSSTTFSDLKIKCKTSENSHLSPVSNDHQISQSLQNLKRGETELTSAVRITNRVGSAETGRKRGSAKHQRCHSQSAVTSQTTQNGLAIPSAAHCYSRSCSSNDQPPESCQGFTRDEAASVEEVFGRKGQRSEGLHPRLVLVSSRVRNISVLRHAVLPGISVMQYNYDCQTLDEILASVSHTLCGRLVHSVAFILTCAGSAIQLTLAEDKVLCRESVHDKVMIEFFIRLKEECCFKEAPSGLRFDFLACTGLQMGEMSFLAQELQVQLGITVGVWRDLAGTDSGSKKGEETNYLNTCIAELYFRLEKLRSWSGQQQQSLAGFEKIRTVGKGAYGTAVLYKKKDDDSLVILKEINMHDLTASERQLALNEVRVLAMLDHPNIISYFDSFEEDGVLMIEMEYADGGTLAQYLSQPDLPLALEREREVLSMFQQIVAAIRHIHQHNILHRDLKTENIFLTKEGVVKVGDFGISKMLGSANKGALTVLGTPYYISPEMCEGKPYSYKSDIWALGCILYEMACLQKTFEGTNLPALVHKIMQGQYAPVKGNYSQEFRDLVTSMLQRDPDLRPSASDIMYPHLSQLMAKFEEPTSDPEDELMASADSISRKVKISPKKMEKRSVLYYLESSTGNMTCITGLPPRMKIKQVGVSSDHVVVVTTERQVYSWGHGDKGQLGHGDIQGRSSPCLVEALKGKSITMTCCGEDFSVFASDNGLVLTCGSGASGCLGHGDWSIALKPRLIEALLSVDVVVVSCGPHHVAVVGREGEVYCWGQGDKGQLGLGTEDHQCQPMRVEIDEPVVFRDVQCGVDGTMFITDAGGIFACGSNEFNKLGLNNRQGFLMAMKNIFNKTEVEGKTIPTPVRALARHRVLAVAMGRHHSAVIVEVGHVYTFGCNTQGQLGAGNVKAYHAPMELKSLNHVSISHVCCGDHYTVASSRNHQLFYWGLRYTTVLQRSDDDNHNTTTTNTTDEGSTRSSINSLLAEGDGLTGEEREEITPRNIPLVETVEAVSCDNVFSPADPEQANVMATPSGNHGDSGVSMTTGGSGEVTDAGGSAAGTTVTEAGAGFRPLSETMARHSFSAGSRDNSRDKEKDGLKDNSVILFEPTEIIRIKQGHEKVLLGNVFCHGENLFIQVETTAPPPRRRTFKKRSFRRRPQQSDATCDSKQSPVSGREAVDDYSSEASEIDVQGMGPPWSKEELSANGDELPLCHDNDDDGNEADDTSDLSDDSHSRAVIDSSMSSIHVNRVLTPVKSSDGGLTPRSSQIFKPNSLNTKSAANSSESNLDRASAEHVSDSSSSEAAIAKGASGRHSQLKVAVTAGVTVKGGNNKVTSHIRSACQGKNKSHEEVLRERLVAKGFVSDVTVKRREEALLCELERMRGEKKKAESQLKVLQQERALQEELLRQEAEKLAQAREQKLKTEVEQLRRELQLQSSQLAERQQLVGHLQKQLQQHGPQPNTQSQWQHISTRGIIGPQNIAHHDYLPSATESGSSRPGNISSRSAASVSRVCSMQ